MKRALDKSLLLTLAALATAVVARGSELRVDLVPRFNGAPLVFDSLTNTTAAGQTISVTRLDFLVSAFALRDTNGIWFELTNWFAYVSAREGRTSFSVSGIPAGRYDRVRFHIGLEPQINHSDAAQWPAGHPLNPDVNRLYWGWSREYIFLALEGGWQSSGRQSGFSFHLATDRELMTVELPVELDLRSNCELDMAMNVDRIFAAPNQIEWSETSDTTHSRTNDTLAGRLRQNIEQAFAASAGRASRLSLISKENATGWQPVLFIASNATPYRLVISKFFPRPDLPRDNPLTEEGVELGRKLFFEPRLSVNNRQSCASCHQPRFGLGEHREVSVGAEGQAGTRNAMPLFNLAWKSSFFWDGRAATLRAQVLQPIQNPIEMHETLTNVVAKLTGSRTVKDAFPLSLRERERENRRQPAVETDTIKKSERLTLLFPLPEGEGQGEGNQDSISRMAAGRQLISAADYPTLFAAAFGTPEISADRIARALEQFLLAQVSFDSKFDRVLNGTAKFTDEEQRGFVLFNTEYDPRRGQFGADCFHCHGGPLFQSQNFANNGLDSEFKDAGCSIVTKRDGDRGKFAVPSLRNVELTAPYMHDGRFKTLTEAVEHYCTGMKRSATLDPNLAKHPDGGVPLSEADKKALVAFLKTLTDERFRSEPAAVSSVAQARLSR